MIKCEECGAAVSAKAQTCPHCGVAFNKKITCGGVVSKKNLAWVDRFAHRFLMIVLIIAVIALVCYVARKFM